MPYIPANVPEEIDSAYLAEEHQRIANAYNAQEGIGQLAFNVQNAPFPDQTVTLAGGQVLLENWDLRGPSDLISDGPINVDPRIHPVNEIDILEDGMYLLNFYLSYSHSNGAEMVFEIFRNGTRTFIGVTQDASQQTSFSTVNATGMLAISELGIIDLRISTPDTSQTINVESGALSVFKLRDLRTRFS